MTLPHERTRAVLSAREFLFRLASPYNGGLKGIKQHVRLEARNILRHYPNWFDLGRQDSFDMEVAEQIGLESDRPKPIEMPPTS